eukprot:9702114-Lingulodinium_polyedra.AAC.1
MVGAAGAAVEQTICGFQSGPWPGHTARTVTNSSCWRCGSFMNSDKPCSSPKNPLAQMLKPTPS